MESDAEVEEPGPGYGVGVSDVGELYLKDESAAAVAVVYAELVPADCVDDGCDATSSPPAWAVSA